jgi:hypothetical protein
MAHYDCYKVLPRTKAGKILYYTAHYRNKYSLWCEVEDSFSSNREARAAAKAAYLAEQAVKATK